MSRRYGRNQRRRAREQIAQAELRITQLSRQEASARQQLNIELRENDNLKGMLDKVRRRLGQYAFALDPSIMTLGRTAADFGVETVGIHAFKRQVNHLERRLEQLPVLLARAERSDIVSGGGMHVRVRYKDGRWGYGLSESIFHDYEISDVVSTVSEELARVIVDDIRRARR